MEQLMVTDSSEHASNFLDSSQLQLPPKPPDLHTAIIEMHQHHRPFPSHFSTN